MTIHEARQVARARGEVDPLRLRKIQRLQREAEAAQSALEQAVAEALAEGDSLNELARVTKVAKTTLLRWAKK